MAHPSLTRLREKPRPTSALPRMGSMPSPTVRTASTAGSRATTCFDFAIMGQYEAGTGYRGALTDDAGPSAGRSVRRGASCVSGYSSEILMQTDNRKTRRAPWVWRIIRARPRLFASFMVSIAATVALAVLTDWRPVMRDLVGWDIGV